ncbi:DUF4329 domain-containing protein [Cognatiyoonia sp. IB215446]|uniref:DUF4329 domain-containing protein n=1 Tax=Cognatiyoonia sp. IB215446 TaxID=3097355 RepID=UPI002A171F17|nr:DUF4329 domain-containing protein [Cognatiyoonia sp. IB215446]MDX8348711.1 DUF4329 domain-containing protein [Cognatiyoonia sp. IB215446]
MTYLKYGIAVALIGGVALVSCTEDTPHIIANTDDVNQFATSVLNDLQTRSIAESREYCGYIFETEDGRLAATPANRGAEDYCDLPAPDADVIASYHTHGSFSAEYDNEVPSVDDVTSDFEAGIDGYISTPGGRIWLVDYSDQIARQLCSAGCVISDPQNDPANSGFIPQSFTLSELRERFE